MKNSMPVGHGGTGRRKKIIVYLLFIGFMITASFGSIMVYYNSAENVLTRQVINSLNAIGQTKADHVQTYLEEQKKKADVFTYGTDYIELLSTSKDDPEYDELYDRVQNKLDNLVDKELFVELDLWDAKGRVVISSTPELVGFDYSDLAFYTQAKEETYFDFYYNPTPGIEMNTLGIVSPITDDETNELLGLFAISMSTESFNKITTSRTGLGETGEVYILNKDSLAITPLRFLSEEETFLKQKVETENSRDCFKEREQVGEHEEVNMEQIEHIGHDPVSVFEDYRGVGVLGTHIYIPERDWCVLAEIDEREALQLLRNELIIDALFILIITTVIMSIFVVISSRLLLKL